MLNELADVVPHEGRLKLARELNLASDSVVNFEWELVLLYALSKEGRVQYEASSGAGSRHPDIVFQGDNGIAFVADVTAVSDDGLEQENPVARFSMELHRLRRKFGLTGSVYYSIDGEADGPTYQDRKMRLKLPPPARIDAVLKEHIAPFFARIRDETLSDAHVAVNEAGVAFKISYRAGSNWGGGHHPSYTTPYSRTRNPVYTSLKAKARQLKQSGHTGPFGVFLCDRGCNLLSQRQTGSTAFGLGDVISEFFRRNSTVAFVAVLGFPPANLRPFTGRHQELRVTGQVFINGRAAETLPAEPLLALLNQGLAHLPPPVATPRDALHWLKTSKSCEGQFIHNITHGGTFMTQTIKMSARRFQQILAGRITAEQFFDDYRMPERQFENPFAAALKLGLTIENITITKQPDLDDDFVEIKFGLPDPAIGKITVKT